MLKTRSKALRGLATGVVIGTAAVIVAPTTALRGLELLTADARMRLASPAAAPPIAIIGITQEDITPRTPTTRPRSQQEGETGARRAFADRTDRDTAPSAAAADSFGPLPWPRRRYAAAINKLKRLGARVIVFDLYFPTASGDPAADEALVRAVREAGNVVLPVYAKVDPRVRQGELVDGVHVLSLPPDQYLERNTPELTQAAQREGHINLSANDPDHLFRRVPAAIAFRAPPAGRRPQGPGPESQRPASFRALAVEAVAAVMAAPDTPVLVEDGRLRVGPHTWPLDRAFPGTVAVDYSGVAEKVDAHAGRWRAPFGPHRSIFLYSFQEFLNDRFPAEAVAGRVVFVGSLLYERHPDVHPTPAGQQPGVIIHALAAQTLLGERYPHWLGGLAQGVFTVLVAVVLSVVFFTWPFRYSLGLLGVTLAALAGVSMFLFEKTGLLIEIVTPAMALTAVCLVGVTHSIGLAGGALRKRERELDTLVELGRLSASLVDAGVHTPSRLIEMGDADVLVPPAGAGVSGAAETVAATISQVVGAEVAVCHLTDPNTNELAVMATCGVRAADLPEELADTSAAAARQAMKEGRAILWQGRARRGRPPAHARFDGSVATLLCVPMTMGGHAAGAMTFLNKHPSAVSPEAYFSEDDLRLVTTFTHQAAVTLENARLYQSMHGLFLDAIKSLAAAIDAKDPYTRGHTARVAQFSALLGRQMSLTEPELQILHLTATLHDIGKIAIPEAVLNKPTGLTPDERRIIEKHPVRGAIILEPVRQLRPVIPGIRHHHERYDGMGYPDGLVGDSIPLLARVIAIADSYDAMTTDRPYRRALSDGEALHEVEQCAGTQFDADLAELFVARFPNVHALFAPGRTLGA